MSANKTARNAWMDSAAPRILRYYSRSFHSLVTLSELLRKGALLLAFLFAVGYISPASADDIEYAYDEAGRLVQATNLTSGEAVRYTYDAVGNITSQISGPISTLAIGHFSPRRGPVGTQVTINGTGFSPTPAANTVRFNGIAATVTSATQSKIVAAVPAAATSGPLIVEVGAASVTSAEPFVVTAIGDGPSISVVLPNVSQVGNIVTIVGANFEAVPVRNRVRFNNANAEIIAATETTLTVRVPADAGSGKIKLTTPRGIAVSPTDFIVVPSGTSATALGESGRIETDGSASTVNVVNHNTYAMRMFEGRVGELLSIGVSDLTFASATLRVYAPDNSLLTSGTVTTAAPGLQLPELTVEGTYSIYVFPNFIGSLNLAIYKPSTSNLTIGTPTSVTISPPGRRALLTFTASANTYADVSLSGVTLSSGTVTLSAPGGVVVESQPFTNTGISFQPWLKQAGQYTLLIDPKGSIGGALVVGLNTSATPTLGAGPQNSQTLSINNTNPTVLTFRAEPNEYLSVLTQITASTNFSVSMSVRTPLGTVLAQRNVGTSYTSGANRIGSGVLNFGPTPTGGTYTVTVQRASGTTGSVNLTLMRATSIPSLPLNSEVAGPVISGQTLITSFDGSVDEFLSIAVTERDGSMRGAAAAIFKPDGTALLANEFTIRTGQGSIGTLPGTNPGDPYRDGTAVLNIGPLPMSGTYRVVLQQSDHARELDTYSGSWRLTLTRPVPGNIAVDGSLQHTRFEINGQGVLYTFTGTAGQFLALGIRTDLPPPSNPNLMNEMAVGVFDPDGNLVATGGMLANGPDNSGSAVLNIGPLSVSGTYRIFLQQLGYWRDSKGGIEAYLSSPMAATLATSGSTQMETARMGQGALVTFTASAGDHRAIRVETTGQIAGSRLRVFSPDGSQLGTTAVIGQPAQFVGYSLFNFGPLAATGTYTAIVEQTAQRAQNVGTFNISVTEPRVGTLPGNATTSVELQPGQPLLYTFAAAQGSYRSLLVSHTGGIITAASVAILDPEGGTLSSGTLPSSGVQTTGRVLLNAGPFPVTGDYSVLIKQTQRQRENPINPPLVLTLAEPVQSTSASIGAGIVGQGVMRSFAGSAGQLVTVQVSETDGEISNTGVRLLAPNGTMLKSATMNATRCAGCAGYNGNVSFPGGQLPVTGEYKILVQQTAIANDASGTGALNINVSNQAAGTASTSNFTTTTPGAYATSTYVASAGESFSVAVISVAQVPASATGYSIHVLRPSGSSEAQTSCATTNSGCELAVRNVSETGTYQIQVRPASNATITGVQTIAAAAIAELPLDTSIPLALSTVGQAAHLSFVTMVRQTFSVSIEGVTAVPANTLMLATVYNAAGIGHGEISTAVGGTINLPELPAGAYSVWIRPQYPATSNMQVTLRSMLGGVAPADGTAVPVTGVAPGQSAFYTFEAQAGESIGIALTDVLVTPASTTHLARVYLYRPGSTSAMTSVLCQQVARCTVSLRDLPESGLYRVMVTPYSADQTLTGTLTVSQAVTATLTPDEPFALNLDAPGRPALLNFTAITGQHFTMNVTGLNPSPADSTVSVVVYDSSGNSKASGTTSTGLTLELPNLPPGNYSVWITQPLPMTSSMQVTLKSTPLLAADGSSVNVDTAALGQTSYYAFEGQAGESIGIALTDVAVTPASTTHLARVYLYRPGSTSAMTSVLCQQTARCTISLRDLPESGTYRVMVTPYSADRTLTGTLTVSQAVTATLTPDEPFALNLDAPGKPALLSFTATAGQHFTMNVTGLNPSPADSTVSVVVYDSLGNSKASGTTSTGLTLELPRLSADTYFVWITQPLPMTSAMQVTLRSTPFMAADGSSVNVDTAALGQTSYYAFEAQAGESIGIALTDVLVTPASTTHLARVYLYRPGSTSAMTSVLCQQVARCTISLRDLPESGSYRVMVTPYSADRTLTGTLTVSKAITGTLTPDEPFALNLDAPGKPALLIFSASAGQHFTMNVTGLNPSPADSTVSVIVYDSSGNTRASGTTSTGLTLELPNFPPGNYFVWITQPLPMTSAMQVTLRSTPFLAADGSSLNVDTAALGQTSYYAFEAQAGESIGIALTDVAVTPASTTHLARVYLYRPGSTSAMTSVLCQQVARCTISLRDLPESGSYRVMVTPYSADRTLTGTLTISRAVTGSIASGSPTPVSLASTGQPAMLSFSLAFAQALSMTIGPIAATPANTSYSAIIYNATGGQVASGSSTTSMTLSHTNLPAGAYTLWIFPALPATATMTVSF